MTRSTTTIRRRRVATVLTAAALAALPAGEPRQPW